MNKVLRLYTYDREWDADTPKLHNVKVKRVPSGYRALERSGLAFGCRTNFGPDSYATSKEGARQAAMQHARDRIKDSSEELAQAWRDLRFLEGCAKPAPDDVRRAVQHESDHPEAPERGQK